MSALFDLHATNEPQFAATPNLSSVPSNNAEQFDLNLAATNTSDRFWNMQKAQAAGYGRIIDDVHALTGERLLNPATNDATMDEIRENHGQPYPMIFQKRLDKLKEKTRALRSSMPEGGYGTEPGYLDPDMVNTRIATESRGAREAAAMREGTGGWVGAFAGGMVGEMANPFNILASFIPATRAPVWLSEQAIGLFMRNVGREAAYQAVTQAGVESVSSAIDYASRVKIGTEPTAGEIAGNILGAGVLGGVIGGVARGAVPAWLQVRRMWGAGAYVPTAVKDAAVTLEGQSIYGGRNPLGVPPSANESALDKAVIDVALNRPADVSGIVAYHGSPHSFTQFESRPGTGEGSQAYGSGTYLAEERKVGEFYRHSTTSGPKAPISPELRAALRAEGYLGFESAGEAVAAMRAHPDWVKRWDVAPGSELEQAFNAHVEASAKVNPGYLYEVNVKHTWDNLLDWDKPLRDQAPEILASLKAAFADVPKQGVKSSEQRLQDLIDQGAKGEDAYMWLATMKGVEAGGLHGEAAASKALADAGIPGHSFLDKVSRDAATGTRNMVIYDPASLDVVRKNDELVKLQKVFDEIAETKPAPKPAAQTPPTAAPRPGAPPPPEQPAGVVKPPGESPEDKAMLDQAKQLIESPDIAVPPEKRAAYNDALKQEQEARVAAGCLGGGAI
jgi:hypothetical protein